MSAQGDSIEELLLKQSYGEYRPTAPLGRGFFGFVFSGQPNDRRPAVAIKVLNPFKGDPTAGVEFDDEGHMLRKLAGCSAVVRLEASGAVELPVQVHGLTVQLPVKYHVLEQAEGCLAEYIEDDSVRDRLPWTNRLRLWRGVVLGVHQMHLRKCAHRDIKCGNALLFPGPDKRLTCKVADLGRARDFSLPPRHTPEYYMNGRGDLRFAAPEHLTWQGRDDWESYQLADIYGLGSLLYELVMGHSITTAALGPSRGVIDATRRDAMQGRFADLGSMRPRFNSAIEMLSMNAPPALRDRLSTLMNQICSPVPRDRLPRIRLGQRGYTGSGLLWLLNQVDILAKIASLQDRRPRYRAGKAKS
ncbi:protein kinase domain-containing protein [Micromonospora matsumotoense]|uniref:protein kinase domain-containing protein n=1 Tax=Micromonospora matsumotoense TaxID=121616 RepID=UPI003D8F6F9E